ncbi:LexA family protein [Roseburia sp. AF12-17LB]|uniref:LexA family protein n=1 Tax=Roseburia sp. AF12-17LB TaxID=2293127 RepID=UPI001FAA6B1B|nr:helix-turn-helix domain-containing protein [Roseburia sp. AF12-17LB]
MRHKSTELMGTIKTFVEEYYKNYRHSPSTTEIADAIGIARGTAYKYLVAMNENGMIRYDGQQISTEQTEKVQTEFTSVALLGAVSCGVPTLEEEYIEEYVSLPASMFFRMRDINLDSQRRRDVGEFCGGKNWGMCVMLPQMWGISYGVS